MTNETTPEDVQSTAEKLRTQAETGGGRTMARPADVSGMSSGLGGDGAMPATGTLGGIGSVGTRGDIAGGAAPGVQPDGTSGASGMPTNDAQPGGGTVGEDDVRTPFKP